MISAAELEERILTSPFHRWLGLRVVSVSPQELRLSATWREEWENGTTARVTHGGILATLLDLAADWALVASQGTPAPTIDFTTHFLRAAAPGDLLVVARPVKLGRSLTVAEAEVLDGAGKQVAVGRGTYASFAPSTTTEGPRS
ncbi:PaaI family thioesterase [Georgenia satyanarayanai]|uniref:PaaI family thioesterase n=1 Tax=Georgenia satyanarayanai TaxID=860221 RepID=UPI0012657A8E|nr:PaaI family thioesterase [Georgenia satyanarayanai]